MAQKTYIITTDCFIKGEPVARGAKLDLDVQKADDCKLIGELNSCGRIIEADDAVSAKRLEAEIKADAAKSAAKPAK